MTASHLAPLLTVADVAARYGFTDRRAARALMDRAGGFRTGGRLFVRADDLDAFERDQSDARRRMAVPEAPAAPKSRPPAPETSGERLTVDWWRA